MQIPPAQERTSEERIFAAISHGSAFLFGWGVILPLIVWISQREKSKFVIFHAAQAIIFQLTQMLFFLTVGLLIMTLTFVLMFGLLIISEAGSGGEPSISLFLLQPFMMIGMFCMMAIYPAIGVFAALLTLGGKDFRYPLLGRWLEKYLREDPAEVLP